MCPEINTYFHPKYTIMNHNIHLPRSEHKHIIHISCLHPNIMRFLLLLRAMGFQQPTTLDRH